MKKAMNYFLAAMDNENGVYNNARWILADDLREELQNAVENMSDCDFVSLWNEYCDDICDYDNEIQQVSEIDEFFGKMYPSEVFDTFRNIDFSDSWYLVDCSSSSDEPTFLVDSSDLVQYLIEQDGQLLNTPSIIEDIFSEYFSIKEELQEMEEEDKKREKAENALCELVEFLRERGSIEDMEAATIAIWQSMQEQEQ